MTMMMTKYGIERLECLLRLTSVKLLVRETFAQFAATTV